MARIIFFFAFSLSISAANFVHTVLPTFATNFVEIHSASSNYLVFRGLEAPSQPFRFQDGVVYVRARGDASGAVQKIRNTNQMGEFGFHLALAGDSLVIKDGYNTFFHRQQNGQWLPDGENLGAGRGSPAYGPVSISGGFLLSGWEVYRWPSRAYVQTLSVPGHDDPFWKSTFDTEDIVVKSGTNLWFFNNVGGYFTNAVSITNPPTGLSLTGDIGDLVAQYGYLFVGNPYDNERGEHSGAVHVYLKSGDGVTHVYQQKLKPALAMAGDRFGSAIAMDVRNFKLYVAAPNRNETRQHSGAIFIYGLSDTRLSRYWVEREKIILRDALDNANLGLTLNVHNDTLYATAAKEIHAFSPGVRLEMFGNGNNINVELDPAGADGSIEFSDDLVS